MPMSMSGSEIHYRDRSRHGPMGRSLKDSAEYSSRCSGKSVQEAAENILNDDSKEKKEKSKE